MLYYPEMKDKNNEITVKHHVLFKDIKGDILANSNDYAAAGKWIDEYCSVESYWQKRESKLKQLTKLREYHKKDSRLHSEIADLKKELKEKQDQSLFKRSANIYDYWIEKNKEDDFLSKSDSRCVLLLTWLMTDPDAHKENTGLCELANIPWDTEPDWEGRSHFKVGNIGEFTNMAETAFEKVVSVKDIVKEAEKNNIRTEIDLDSFSKGPSKRLLEDLIARPSGVAYSEKHHGKRQPTALKEMLKRSKYEELTKYIHKVKSKIIIKGIEITKK